MVGVRTSRLGSLVLALATVASAGCATFSRDGGFIETQQAVKQATGADASWHFDERSTSEALARADALLASPLTADTAVQVALLSNPGLQASYAELRIAESDRVQACLLYTSDAADE